MIVTGNEAEEIRLIQAATGEDEVTAGFIHAIETGKAEGDAIDREGKDPDELPHRIGGWGIPRIR